MKFGEHSEHTADDTFQLSAGEQEDKSSEKSRKQKGDIKELWDEIN